ncbi:phytanoyl-CoA dioxygenase family protein [Gynuella sunshinyii]|uniref:Protein involved in biosynthesis of mitomycin antibiotics/polyketide fumonisin n=1 Tax=Gynuella sunshinyii YC6258 TaxID=1445510 RepID=A0A0C5VMV0_9GAMM|nr:phytanoyl-CoA dioxygenase family protein [Gynuella sunshinyii]AJQ96057.1 protein involved in biosynthesis of mitomycin antibiotics/polyketide fumonisin [Gynuella sunshinyii YC6258]
MSFNIVEHGLEQHPQFLDQSSVKTLIEDLQQLPSEHPKHGLRNAEKKLKTVFELASSDRLTDFAARYLSDVPQIVRVIVFDKTVDKNWLVAWHQDKTISVSKHMDISGWGPWSIKDGQHHVQPDLAVLNSMITFRLHLDDADECNGGLKVIPGSHKSGILTKAEIDHTVLHSVPFICSAKSGDLLLMRPHLLHASSRAITPGRRRIVHIEYSSYPLPEGLSWA